MQHVKKEKVIILDEFYNFERSLDYIPMRHVTTEDEIREICKKNKILIGNISTYQVWRVKGKKIRNKKTFEAFYQPNK